MARKSTLMKPETVDVSTHNATLAEWIETISTFHAYYTHLSGYTQKNLSHSQCPAGQLELLLTAMQAELIKLTQDLDQHSPSQLASTRKLAAHTRILNQLNKRAQTLMLLTTFTTS